MCVVPRGAARCTTVTALLSDTYLAQVFYSEKDALTTIRTPTSRF